jgi:predicted dehydrogenase
LIGAGNISSTHARALAGIPGTRVVAVCGSTLSRAAALARTVDATAVDDVDRLFGIEPLDMVVVGTPSGLHGAHGTAGATRGVHVLVEKPIEISTARADQLIEQADRAGVTLGVIFQDRLKPDVRRFKALVDDGALGSILLARAEVPWWRPPEYYRSSRWRGTWALDGGGALMNQAIHTVDLLLWLCGPVKRACGRTATRFHDIEVEDTAVAVLEFRSGALATLEAATCVNPGRPRRIAVAGSKASATLEGDRLLGDGEGGGGPAPDNAGSPIVADESAHRAVFVDFIEAVRGHRRPACDGREGRRSVALVEAIYESSRRGAPVDVND